VPGKMSVLANCDWSTSLAMSMADGSSLVGCLTCSFQKCGQLN